MLVSESRGRRTFVLESSCKEVKEEVRNNYNTYKYFSEDVLAKI